MPMQWWEMSSWRSSRTAAPDLESDMHLPEDFIRNVTHVRGDDGRRWLDGLPSLIDACAREYGLTVGEPFELSYNFVAPATLADGSEAVLKLSPHGDDFAHEVRATRAFGGDGMARLIAADEERGVALLERLRPGRMLVELDGDEEQTRIAAGVMRELRAARAAADGLPATRHWFRAFAQHRAEHGGAGPLPRDVFEHGEETYASLLESTTEEIVLHGDLHHYNILSAGRAPWLAIDPHGVTGDPVFEVGAFFGNPSGIDARPRLDRILARRADIFAETLGYDRARILRWAFAYQVLSAVWSAENQGTKWRGATAVASAIRTLL